MISIKATKNGEVSGALMGSLDDIMAETIMIVRHVYQGISEQDKEAGNTFRECIGKTFEDGVVFCADEDMADVCRKSVERFKKEANEEVKEALDGILEKIEELVKEIKGADDGK